MSITPTACPTSSPIVGQLWGTHEPSTTPSPITQSPKNDDDKTNSYMVLGWTGLIISSICLIVWNVYYWERPKHPISSWMEKNSTSAIVISVFYVGVWVAFLVIAWDGTNKKNRSKETDLNSYSLIGYFIVMILTLMAMIMPLVTPIYITATDTKAYVGYFIMIFVFIILGIVFGGLLIGVESRDLDNESLKEERSQVGIASSIYFLIATLVLMYQFTNYNNSTLFYILRFIFGVTIICVCTWGVAQSISDYREDNYTGYTQVIASGSVFLIYGIIGTIYSGIQYNNNKELGPLLWYIVPSLVLLLAGCCMVGVGAVNSENKETDNIDDDNFIPVNPNIVAGCTNITNTISSIDWSEDKMIVDIKLAVLLNNLEYENGSFKDQDIISLSKDTNIFTLKYINDPPTIKLEMEGNNVEIPIQDWDIKTIKIPIEGSPHTKCKKFDIFNIGLNITSYKDVNGKFGVITLYSLKNGQIGTNEDSKIINNFKNGPNNWGNDTKFEVYKNGNTYLAEKITYCQKYKSDSTVRFADIPVIYQICFILIMTALLFIGVWFMGVPKFRQALFGQNITNLSYRDIKPNL